MVEKQIHMLKQKKSLQSTLDLYWLIHNFVREHYSIKQLPAIRLGNINKKMSMEDIMTKINMVF